MLPGFATIMIVGAGFWWSHRTTVAPILHSANLLAVVAAFGAGAFVAAWIVGTVLDACGNLLEWALDRHWPINWDFILAVPIADFERLNEWYLAYYLLNRNYALGALLIVALTPTGVIAMPVWAWLLLFVVFAILVADAAGLRRELARLMGTGFPDDGVYARLGRSTIDPDGVGVFAIKDIKKGSYVFEPDDERMVWISAGHVGRLPSEIRRLYHDFGPLVKGKYGVPTSLSKLTLSWYVNEPNAPERPNLGCDSDFRFYALADIKAGDELTADYSKYCETPPEE